MATRWYKDSRPDRFHYLVDIFSSAVALEGRRYNLLRIAAGHEWMTALRTRFGSFEYLVLPFGLINAPASFQAYINRALADMVDNFMIVYLDDILIYSRDVKLHTGHVRSVLPGRRREGRQRSNGRLLRPPPRRTTRPPPRRTSDTALLSRPKSPPTVPLRLRSLQAPATRRKSAHWKTNTHDKTTLRLALRATPRISSLIHRLLHHPNGCRVASEALWVFAGSGIAFWGFCAAVETQLGGGGTSAKVFRDDAESKKIRQLVLPSYHAETFMHAGALWMGELTDMVWNIALTITRQDSTVNEKYFSWRKESMFDPTGESSLKSLLNKPMSPLNRIIGLQSWENS